MTRVLILSLVAVTALSACGRSGAGNVWGNRLQFDGQYFRVQLSTERGNRSDFTVTVNDAVRTLTGAREAAEHRANKHCVKQYGTSDLTWDVSPDVEDSELPIVNGDLILKGTCDGWR